MRNGPEERRDTNKIDSAFNDVHDKSDVKVKLERKEDEVIMIGGSEKRQNDILNAAGMSHPHSHTMQSMQSIMERNRMLLPPGYGMDRLPHPGLWGNMNPFDRSLDVNHHRMELQREMERERERMMHRFPNPLTQMIDHERFKEQQELMLRERELERRRELERMSHMDRERLGDLDRSKIPPLRPADMFMHGMAAAAAGGLHLPHSGSPLLMNNNHNNNHTNSSSKSNSPSSAAGAPPPLIPSNSTRSHNNSPATNKPKPTASPLLNNSSQDATKDKRDSDSRNNEIEAGSR